MGGLTMAEMQSQRDDMRDAITRVRDLHSERHRDVEGFTLRWCRECGQNWPCPTREALNG